MSENITSAIKAICDEKGLSFEAVIETINAALAAAYRKDFGEKNQNIKVEFDPETGKSKIYDLKTVVEDMPEEALQLATLAQGESEEEKRESKKTKKQEVVEEDKQKSKKAKKQDSAGDEKQEKSVVETESAAEVVEGEEEEVRKFNPKTEIQVSEAKLLKKSAKVGDEIKTKLEAPEAYGRMAAQTAKQVIIQKIREAEREMVFSEFKDKEGEVVTGIIQRREPKLVLVDLGKAVGVLPKEEQIYSEKYEAGQRIKVYVKSVGTTSKGPEVLLSRTSEEILKKVFYLEIPEISNGLIDIKSVAREAGSRSKIAITANNNSVDPIGSCVGQRGSRIQTIIKELGGEKVDIIEYDEDPAKFIINALSPAKVIEVSLNAEEKRVDAVVASDQLSLAIGKGGQNVRLAARLTGWKIDIVEKKEDGKKEVVKEVAEEAEDEESKEADEKTDSAEQN